MGILVWHLQQQGLHVAQPEGTPFANTFPATMLSPIAGDGTHLFTAHLGDAYDQYRWGTYLLPVSEPQASGNAWIVRLDLPR